MNKANINDLKKKIDLKKGKYVLPMLILLPVLFIGYQISQLSSSDDKPKEEVKEELDTDIAEADVDTTFSSRFSILTEEPKYIDSVSEEAQEQAQVASINAQRQQSLQQLDMLQLELEQAMKQQPKQETTEERIERNRREVEYRSSQNQSRYDQKQDELLRNLQKQQEMLQKQQEELQKKMPIAVQKVETAEQKNSQTFNTVNDNKKNQSSNLIKAIVDQTVKLREGFRIRLKLMEDIKIADMELVKGDYLYAVVTAFGNQRVKGKVNSVIKDDRLLKVDLEIYDNDGIEGFYVPSSDFREIMRDALASSIATGSSITFDEGNNQWAKLGARMIEDAYRSLKQGVASSMKHNKARIKYNTQVYLLDNARK